MHIPMLTWRRKKMSNIPFSILVLSVLISFNSLITAASVGTCLTGATPFELANSCGDGWYCPLYNSSDSNTYPVQCAATNDCIITRLTTKFCDPQGTYEPILCSAGYYCPTPVEKVECPENHYCPLGQSKPISCGSMTTCPKGSKEKTEWGSLLALGVGDVAALCVYFLILFWNQRQQKQIRNRCLSIPLVNHDLKKVHHCGTNDDDKNKSCESLEEGTHPHTTIKTSTEILCDGFKHARGSLPLMILEFQDLSLTIPGNASKGLKPLTILKGVTGSVRPGKVTAIMGPSGAGKTTLLSTLLGNYDSSWVMGGSLLINGQSEIMRRFRPLVGYVPQDDVMHRDLTVYENIAYAAHIRLPRDWSLVQREEMIDATIVAMQLSHVQHTQIGDETVRGISGGQRKRVNIGMEIVTAPSLLLLDEPTSGLDSTAAMDICKVLKQLAAVSGITVTMVIHQPRVEIWEQLDELLMLAKGGETVYQGPQRLSEFYFSKYHNVQLQPQDNPADALMDIIASQGPQLVASWKTQQGPAKVQVLLQMEKEGLLKNDTQKPLHHGIVSAHLKTEEETGEFSNKSIDEEAEFLRLQDLYAEELQRNIAQSVRHSFPSAKEAPTLRHTAGFISQLYHACMRSLSKQLVNLTSLFLEIGLALLASGMMGSMAMIKYQGILSPPYTLLSPTPLERLIPSFFFSVGVAISLSAASAGVSVFGEELVIYRREIAAGHDHLAYYLGVVVAQYPRLCLDALHFAPLVHYLAQPLTPFITMFVVVFQLYAAIYGLAFLVSFLVSRKNAALLAVVASLMFSSMTGKGGIPEVIQVLSPSRWATEAIFHYETAPYRHIMEVARSAENGGYTLGRVDLDLGLMFLVGILYRLLAYVAMRYADRKIIVR